MLTITVLSALVTISVFLYTVKKAKETVEKRRRSSIISSEEDSSEEPKIHHEEDQINKIAHSETCIGSSINVKNTNDLYTTIPKYYSNENIQKNVEAINKKRKSTSSESSRQNSDVRVLSDQLLGRKMSDDLARIALRNSMMTREVGEMSMNGGFLMDRKTSWTKPDMRKRHSTWGGSLSQPNFE